MVEIGIGGPLRGDGILVLREATFRDGAKEIKAILESADIKTGLMGTVRYEIGDRVIPAQRTTPESIEVQQMMSQMLKADCQACVMEVSSHALDQGRVDAVHFDVGVFTNLTRDHLDYHGDMERYGAAKSLLFFRTGLKAGVINLVTTACQQLAPSW